MIELVLKLGKELGPHGSLGILAVLSGVALSTGLSLDDLVKQFPPESLLGRQAIGVGMSIVGIALILMKLVERKEEKAAKAISDKNWTDLVRILQGHQALSAEDVPIFPNRVVRSFYRLRSEIQQYSPRVSDDEIASRIASNIQWCAQSFCSSVERIEYESKLTLNSDVDIRLSELSAAHQAALKSAHYNARQTMEMLIRGVYLGRGRADFMGFHQGVRWE